MRLALELIFFVIILLGATFLVLLNLSLSSHGTVFGFPTSNIYTFAMLNTIIWAILVTSFRPSAEGYDDFLPFLHSACEENRDETIDENDNQSSTDSDDYQYDSSDTDGYDGEEDESDGNDENDWDDVDEEYDDTLNSRIEEFIAKVTKGWREEQMEENFKIKQVD